MPSSFAQLLTSFANLFPTRRALRSAASRRMPRLRSKLFLEMLEDRRLLASDLSIVKIGPTGNVAAGANATYTIVVSNAGPDAATAAVIVGHQPTLGEVAALLQSGAEGEWNVKKGGIWWFSSRERDGGMEVVLRAVFSPELT